MNKVYNRFEPKGLTVGDVIIAKEYVPNNFNKLTSIRVIADARNREDRTLYEVTFVYKKDA